MSKVEIKENEVIVVRFSELGFYTGETMYNGVDDDGKAIPARLSRKKWDSRGLLKPNCYVSECYAGQKEPCGLPPDAYILDIVTDYNAEELPDYNELMDEAPADKPHDHKAHAKELDDEPREPVTDTPAKPTAVDRHGKPIVAEYLVNLNGEERIGMWRKQRKDGKWDVWQYEPNNGKDVRKGQMLSEDDAINRIESLKPNYDQVIAAYNRDAGGAEEIEKVGGGEATADPADPADPAADVKAADDSSGDDKVDDNA